MKTLKEIDDVARMWQKTKDKKYKDEWYRLIKKFRHEYFSSPFTKRSWTGKNRDSETS